MIKTISKLVEVYGPSGHEDRVRNLIRGEIEHLADSVRVDALGNLIAIVNGDGTGRRVMLAAHMDEIGLIVTHVDEKGFLRFGRVGGVRAELCVGNRVRFESGTMGVIWVEKRDSPNTNPEFDHLYIDVGAKNRADCPIRVGDMAVFDRTFVVQGDRWTAKAMDDRIGCAVLIEVLRTIRRERISLAHTLQMVFSAQEEVGVRGATTAAYALEPEIGIAVDVTLTGDMPKAPTMAVDLGGGPAIKVKDAGLLAHPGLVQLMADRAKEAGIPCQYEVMPFGGTDAQAMQLTRSGSIAGAISIPCRYVHSASEMVDAQDVRSAVSLLTQCLKGPLAL